MVDWADGGGSAAVHTAIATDGHRMVQYEAKAICTLVCELSQTSVL